MRDRTRPRWLHRRREDAKARNVLHVNIVVIDADLHHAKTLSYLLSDQGYTVSTLGDSDGVSRVLRDYPVDLLVLSTDLPGKNSITLCAAVRRDHPYLAIILTSPRPALAALTRGLAAGADDFIARPYEPAELLARIRAVWRRSQHAVQNRSSALLQVGQTHLELGRRIFVGASGEAVALTPTEMRVLACLMRRAGETMTREQLLMDVWGKEQWDADNCVDVYIRRLRMKIEAKPEDRNLIRTVKGVGFVYTGAACGKSFDRSDDVGTRAREE